MIVLNECVFDDFIYAKAYTASSWNDRLGRPDLLGFAFVVDQVAASDLVFTAWLEGSCDGKSWVPVELLDEALSETDPNVFFASAPLDTDSLPGLLRVKMSVDVEEGGSPSKARATVHVIGRDQARDSDDIQSDRPAHEIYRDGAAPRRSPRTGAGDTWHPDKRRRDPIALSLPIFDDVVNYVLGEETGLPRYSYPKFNDILGKYPRISIHAVTDRTTGGTPELTCTLEHSGDGRTWSVFGDLINAEALSTSDTTSLSGFVDGAAGDVLLGHVRVAIDLTDGTLMAAASHVRITARVATATPPRVPA